MKKLLLVALVLFVANVKGQSPQKKYDALFIKNSYTSCDILRVNLDSLKMNIPCKSDTLYINYSPIIKFIKIGDRVYKIESPTLTEVPKSLILSGGWLNDRMPLTLTPNTYYSTKP